MRRFQLVIFAFIIQVSLSKRLRLPGSSRTSQAQDLHQQLWRIHKDEFMGSFAIMRYSNFFMCYYLHLKYIYLSKRNLLLLWFWRFNLIQLFLQNEQSSHLRKMIVDLEVNAHLICSSSATALFNEWEENLNCEILQVPRFDSGCQFSQDPAISYIWSEKNLNDDQRRAILKVKSYWNSV